MKIINIIQGWAAYFMNEKSKLAIERAAICKNCDKAVCGTYEKILNDSIKEIQGLKCNVCGCPLSTKLRSQNEVCPSKKW